jgi:hypothetical protein
MPEHQSKSSKANPGQQRKLQQHHADRLAGQPRTPEEQILHLQKTIGNSAVQRLIDSGDIKNYVTNLPAPRQVPTMFQTPTKIQRETKQKDDTAQADKEDEQTVEELPIDDIPLFGDAPPDDDPTDAPPAEPQAQGDIGKSKPEADANDGPKAAQKEGNDENQVTDDEQVSDETSDLPEDEGAGVPAAAPPPIPPPLPDVAANLTTDSAVGRYATQVLGQLQVEAQAQQAALAALATATRAQLEGVFAAAQSESESYLQNTQAQIAAIIEGAQAQVAAAQSEREAGLQSQAQAHTEQIEGQKQRAGSEINTRKAEKTADAKALVQKKADDAKQVGQTKAAQQSGVLGKFTAKAFLKVATTLAKKLLGGMSQVVNKLASLFSNIFNSVIKQIKQILTKIWAAVQHIIGFIRGAFQTVTHRLKQVAAQISKTITKIALAVKKQLAGLQNQAIESVNMAEMEASQAISTAYQQAAAIIQEVVTIAPPDDPNNPDDTIQAELIAVIDQVYTDASAAMLEVQTALQTQLTTIADKVQADVQNLLGYLAAQLAEVTAKAQTQLQQVTEGFIDMASEAAQSVLSAVAQALSAVASGVDQAVSESSKQADTALGQVEGKAAEIAQSNAPYAQAASKTADWYNQKAPQKVKAGGEQVQRKEDKTSFWSGVGSALLDLVKGLGMIFAGVVGTLALAAVASFIPVVGPALAVLILGAGVIAIVGMLVVGLAMPFITRWQEMTAAKYPMWKKIILIPFVGILELIGVFPLLEGIVGSNFITGEDLTNEEQGKKVTTGAINLALTFATAFVGRAVKAVGRGATAMRRTPLVAKKMDEVVDAARQIYAPLKRIMERFGRSADDTGKGIPDGPAPNNAPAPKPIDPSAPEPRIGFGREPNPANPNAPEPRIGFGREPNPANPNAPEPRIGFGREPNPADPNAPELRTGFGREPKPADPNAPNPRIGFKIIKDLDDLRMRLSEKGREALDQRRPLDGDEGVAQYLQYKGAKDPETGIYNVDKADDALRQRHMDKKKYQQKLDARARAAWEEASSAVTKIDDVLTQTSNKGRPNAVVGDGSSEAALIYEARTGNQVFGRWHYQKVQDAITALENAVQKIESAMPKFNLPFQKHVAQQAVEQAKQKLTRLRAAQDVWNNRAQKYPRVWKKDANGTGNVEDGLRKNPSYPEPGAFRPQYDDDKDEKVKQ